MIAADLSSIWIAQVPLKRVHPRLNRSELRFLFSDLLICGLPAVVLFGRRIFQMFAAVSGTFLFILFFLFFCCEVQREAANHLSLCIGELKGGRSLAVIRLRNVEEDGCPERRVVAGIRGASLIRVGETVVMSQPSLLRREQETGVRSHRGVLRQLLKHR